MEMKECLKSKLSGIFRVKMEAKNIVFGSTISCISGLNGKKA